MGKTAAERGTQMIMVVTEVADEAITVEAVAALQGERNCPTEKSQAPPLQ